MLIRLVGCHGHILTIVNYYAPEHIRAEMVSDIVYGTYKYFTVNVAEVCPSLLVSGKISSPTQHLHFYLQVSKETDILNFN